MVQYIANNLRNLMECIDPGSFSMEVFASTSMKTSEISFKNSFKF